MRRHAFLVAFAFAVSWLCARTSAAPTPASPTAAESLDQMDTRIPLPLLPMMANHQKQNMREHLLAVQEIVTALATDDYPAIEKAAGRIGFSEQMGQMCTHMGAGAPGFTEQALAFHHTADRIGVAAKAHDRGAVLTAFAATLQSCTACHATWKQQVVDEAAWTRLTATAAPTGHGTPH
jgi:hypothetical protein